MGKKITVCESVGKPGQYVFITFSREKLVPNSKECFLLFFSKEFLNELTAYVRLRQNPNFTMPSLMNKIHKYEGYKTTQPESIYLNRS